jgi:short-subunit dehydrogenase
MIDVNIVHPLMVSQIYLPSLITRAKDGKKKSGLICVSSASAACPLAGHSTYGGTKVFEDIISKAVYFENKADGVEGLSHRAGLTQTKMVGNFKLGLYCVSPDS